jgi:predicted ABC-type ATPase
MNDTIPLLRMFAGPNGSGKTTVKMALARPPHWFGIYINPDDIERSIQETGVLDLVPFEVRTTAEEIRRYFAESRFLQQQGLATAANAIECSGTVLDFTHLRFNSYCASVLSDFLRRKLLDGSKSFTFETVMSSRDKVELLREAQARGFRTYLYYIATDSPEINIQRVKNRVAEGGHDVPEAKIIDRYHRSLALLPEAIRYSNRAFFFDTSSDPAVYVGQVIDGTTLEPAVEESPVWFAPIWQQFASDTTSPP